MTNTYMYFITNYYINNDFKRFLTVDKKISFHFCSEHVIKMLSIPKDQVQPKPKPVVIPKSDIPKPNSK